MAEATPLCRKCHHSRAKHAGPGGRCHDVVGQYYCGCAGYEGEQGGNGDPLNPASNEAEAEHNRPCGKCYHARNWHYGGSGPCEYKGAPCNCLSFESIMTVLPVADATEGVRPATRRCEACGLPSQIAEYIHVRVTNGGLFLCRQCLDEVNGKSPLLAAERQRASDLAGERNRREQQVAKLQAFKDWVHSCLDSNGVPHHPEGTHGASGCRIGDRMDWLMARLAEAIADRDLSETHLSEAMTALENSRTRADAAESRLAAAERELAKWRDSERLKVD